MFHLPLPFFAAQTTVETVPLAEDDRNVRAPANIALASQDARPRCQTACKVAPRSASNVDPLSM
ncbi:hypothetical protein, partial [Ancylobacter oerskovii]|uniref:hypothetical protein n=1 Tax=Ancylobacter oerskovii TaxID=459519 RepID=UPI003CCEA530|nr:hypothetical protein [Ancylobacter oerskovii]